MIALSQPRQGVLHRRHPFTVGAIVLAIILLAFATPAPWGPVAIAAAAMALAVAARCAAVLKTALSVAAPFWVFLGIIHGVLGDDPLTAVTLGSRITALLTGFLLLIATVSPARLVDALLASGWPFSAAYLLAATLQAVPRLRARAALILEAQRCRGLRVRGSLAARLSAIVPLVVPLVLGALAEVDERAMALEARSASAPRRRTPLWPPADGGAERAARWALLGAAVAFAAARILA